jgi:sirohydrochlorin ferrochelatase
MKKLTIVLVIALVVAAISAGVAWSNIAAAKAADGDAPPTGSRKVGVLLVSHGSRSARWREMLVDVEVAVKERVLADGSIAAVRSAFMEYNEPSIATRLEEFDAEGFSDVIVISLLLTVSSHSFDDIPTICGVKADASSTAHLQSEGIRTYKPRAKVHLTPLLDFPKMLEDNVLRRVRKLSKNAAEEGVVLVAYGDHEYTAEWDDLMERLKKTLAAKAGITVGAHAWCGHVAHYSKEPTKSGIAEVLKSRERALVVPLLVAVDENFQHKIIGGAVQESGFGERVVYVPDAILPDAGLEEWVVDIALSSRRKLEAKP